MKSFFTDFHGSSKHQNFVENLTIAGFVLLFLLTSPYYIKFIVEVAFTNVR